MDSTEQPRVLIRTLQASDAERLARIDQHYSGRNRRVWLEGELRRALQGSDVRVSLGAELDGALVGAVLAQVQYGEFGVAEPVAVLGTILVDPGHRGEGVGRELIEQLSKNLQALRVERIRTEVSWRDPQLLGFLAQQGFEPVPRLVLERSVG